MRYSLCLLFGLFGSVVYTQAQDLTIDTESLRVEDLSASQYISEDEIAHLNYLDSIKNNSPSREVFSAEDLGVIRRLRSTTKTIPLDYNLQVKEYIEKYTSSNWRPYMNRLLGLSRHYFRIYDKVFQETNIPEEVKYLSLVESSLNPHLISSAGAVGPWQFIYGTAKGYDLDMNSHIDERKDAYAASRAVSQYLQESYDQFNDWLLALASYNCGRGGVKRAIERSGLTNPNFWELAPYLPRETRNYIPKFVAMTYVMSNADYFGIEAMETELDLEVEEVLLERSVNLHQVANALGVKLVDLKTYNPAFKKDLVPASKEKPRRILLPVTPNKSDSLLYLALNTNTEFLSQFKEEVETKYYKVKRGETLASLSKKFGVSVQDLKAWNGLSNNSHLANRNLIVEKPLDTRLAAQVQSASSRKKASSSDVTYYIVKKGDSLERIASKHKGVTVSKLKADNNLKGSLIKPGMKIKIKRG